VSSERSSTPADPLYLALGRFLVEFSQFVGHMQAGLLAVAGTGRGVDVGKAWQIATTELAADQLRNVFFATCSALTALSADEAKIRDGLNKQARQLIEDRNRVMHGVWYASSTTGGEETRWDKPLGLYERISLKEDRGITDRSLELTIPELEALADVAREMRALVWEFVSGCLRVGPPWPGVADRLQVHEGKVIRREWNSET
jgi:hypothetical protein